ncbi:hypothetical protein L6164_007260 [Bauhinia variegata]|uniref:Uncharacterized protein n=1 Tax=Bauhinia variegata TaxID=167791 RepID=A0ACB9PCJ1_BAUVA|nr:hypothetical protein L6164_007260 [Bauhinia variegata]
MAARSSIPSYTWPELSDGLSYNDVVPLPDLFCIHSEPSTRVLLPYKERRKNSEEILNESLIFEQLVAVNTEWARLPWKEPGRPHMLEDDDMLTSVGRRGAHPFWLFLYIA